MSFEITVSVKSHPGAEYIGRGSPLGNPFVMRTEIERDLVCDLYLVWLCHKVKVQDRAVMNELHRLAAIALQRPLVLGCFCAPRRCHGNTVKEFLTSLIAAKPDDDDEL